MAISANCSLRRGESSLLLIRNCAWAFIDAIHSSKEANVLFINVFFRAVFLNHQIIDNKVLALHSVLTHVVLQQLSYLVGFVQRYLLQTHVGTDKTCEFIGRNLTKTFESGDFWIGS